MTVEFIRLVQTEFNEEFKMDYLLLTTTFLIPVASYMIVSLRANTLQIAGKTGLCIQCIRGTLTTGGPIMTALGAMDPDGRIIVTRKKFQEDYVPVLLTPTPESPPVHIHE